MHGQKKAPPKWFESPQLHQTSLYLLSWRNIRNIFALSLGSVGGFLEQMSAEQEAKLSEGDAAGRQPRNRIAASDWRSARVERRARDDAVAERAAKALREYFVWLKRTGHPPDRKIRDFAETISAFLATPSPLIRQNLRFRRNFVKHFSIPWNSDKFSSKSARKHLKLIHNSQKMMNFAGKNCKTKNEKLTNIWVWSGAKEWESCRSRKMWKNAPTLAIVGTHTAENEPSKVLAEIN